MRTGFTPDLEVECRRPDSRLRTFIDAEIEVGSDIRRRRAQWQLADGVVLRSHDFVSGNALTAVSQTAALTLANAPAGNDLYEVHWKLSITPVVPGFGSNDHRLVVAIETRPAAGAWTERARFLYEVIRTPGQTAAAVKWDHEAQEVRVPGMTSTSELRLLIKSASGPGGWSFSVHGFNLATDLDPLAGVNYHTGLAVDFLRDGGVTLADTVKTLVQNTVSDSYMQDLGGPPRLTAESPYKVALLGWDGTGMPPPRDAPIDRIVAFLHPRVNGASAHEVAYWACQPFLVVPKDASGQLTTFSPLATAVVVPAQEGDSPEDITFSWATLPTDQKPRPRIGYGGGCVIFFWAIKADGTKAANVGLGQDSTSTQVSSGNVVLKTSDIHGATGSGGASTWFISSLNDPVFRVRVESGNYPSTATVAFTGAGVGSQFALLTVPTKTVQFICRAEPNGGTVVFQVRNDADSGWVTITDGQNTDDLGLAKNQTRKGQVILTATTNLDASPTVVEFGMREVTIFPLHFCARLGSARWAVDPLQLLAETTNARIVAYRDNVNKEFIDRVTTLLSAYFVGQLTLRVWVGTPDQPRWMHIDDFLVDDETMAGPEASLDVLGLSCLERGQLPIFDSSTETTTPLTYANKSLKFVYDDLLSRIGVSSRFLGPGVEDAATLVSKVITDSQAKDELDAIDFLDGSARITSQGKIKSVRIFGPKAPVRIFAKERIKWVSVTPGYRQRQPEVRIPWQWSDAEQRYQAEHKAVNASAILRLGRARIDPPQLLPDAVTRWIPSASLAERVGFRHVSAFGAGMMLWFFGCDTPEPQLEPGDCVAVPTSLFASRDPITDQPITGDTWAIGVIVSSGEDFRSFGLFVRSYADILGGAEAGTRLGFAQTRITALQPYANMSFVVRAVVMTVGAAAVRIVGSTAGMPTDATVRAAALQAVDATGTLITGSLAAATAGSIAYVKAFAYERADGTGKESVAAVAQLTLDNLRRTDPLSPDFKYALLAASSDGVAADRTTKIDGQTRTFAQIVTYLVPNAEFDIWESASQPHAWSVDTGDSSVAAKDTSVVFSGDASAKYSFGAGGSAGTYRGFKTNDLTKGTFCVPLRPGIAYTLKIATRVSAIGTGQGYRITINHNAARTIVSQKAIAFAAATIYQLNEFTFVTPAAAEANAELLVEFTRGSTSATDFWVDSLRIDELEVKDLYDNGTVSSAFTIDWANGQRQKVTLAGSSLVCSFKNAIPGAKNTLLLMQDVTGSRLLPVFDATVLWPSSGTAPTLSTGGGLTDELAFVAQTTPTLRYYGSSVAIGYLQPTPSVNGTPAVTQISIAATAHLVNMPAAVTAGDLLLMIVAWAASPGAVTTPTGWTSDGTTSIMSVFHKVSDGTEGGATVGVTTGNAVKAAAQTYRIQTWFGAVAGVTVALGGGSGTSADPSPVTPSWGADRDLWIAGVAVAANPAITDPANYGTFQQTDDGSVAVRLRTGRRTLYAATEDPAAFTWTGTQSWTAVTISVRPPG